MYSTKTNQLTTEFNREMQALKPQLENRVIIAMIMLVVLFSSSTLYAFEHGGAQLSVIPFFPAISS
jgi:hypothetical protein